jgi:Fe/S biogenesis protein NfuA
MFSTGGEASMITITETAKKKFLEAAKAEGREGHGLRVIVRGGGTLQPEFALNFVGPEEETSADTVVDAGGLTIFADAESTPWLEGAVVDFIDTLSESGFKVDAPKAGLARPEGPVADAIRQLLDQRINPAIAAHGGVVSLVAVEEETAYLRFGGGCQGCGMINVTLKQGVERVLFDNVPQITKVMDVTDHAAGQNPYYQPSK